MNKHAIFLLICTTLLYLTRGAFGIWCFQCNSVIDPSCANIAPNDTSSPYYKFCEYKEREPTSINKYTTLQQPPRDNELFCRKIYQKIHDRNGLITVIRKCGWIKHPELDCYSISQIGHHETVCQCFEDGCNSAFRKSAHVGLLTSVLIMLSIHL